MQRTKQISANAVFALNVLLLFLLLFEGQLAVPRWLMPAGRLHPLLLHLPIGLLLLAGLLPLLKKEVDARPLYAIQSFVLHLAALTAVLTALMGLFLAQEDGYQSALVDQHKWTGAGVSLLSYGLLLLHRHYPARERLFHGALLANIVLLIIAGHLGATLTHGEDFVLAPLRDEAPAITENTPVYVAAVQPILEGKCYSCHNERKSKGELVMTDPEKLRQGGENGPPWIAGNAEESLLIQRLRLPLADEAHMPPEGKPQLSEAEIELLHAWIDAGADLEQPLKDLDPAAPLFTLVDRAVAGRIAKAEAGPQYAFDPAPASTLESLNGPFRTVRPLALRSPALHAEIFVRRSYEPRLLEELTAVREQLTSLNLTNLPVSDEELRVIAQFPNLEKLILNGTDISGATLPALQSCERLRSLALANTAVTADIAAALPQLPALEEVYVWNTGIDEEALAVLREQFPDITFHGGYRPDDEELLPLPAPRLKNESPVLAPGEKVILENKFPGADIRYTTDGNEPDSLASPVYEAPIAVKGLTTVKARTYREGWLTSETAEFLFFQAGLPPDTARLRYPPDPKYPGAGGAGLYDGRKGKADNFLGNFWLGYRDTPFEALVDMGEQPPRVEQVVVSYLRNIFSYIVPPASVEVWGGDDPRRMERLARLAPEQPAGYMPNLVTAVVLDLPPSNCRYYKVTATPVARLPQWHRGAGDKGWVFVDELFFY